LRKPLSWIRAARRRITSAENITWNGVNLSEQAMISPKPSVSETQNSITNFTWSADGLYQSSRLYDEAIADYSQSVELNPDCVDAYLERGCIYGEQKKNYDAAIKDFNRVIELNPHNPDAKSYLATFEIERSAPKDAWRSPILTGNYVSPEPWYKRGSSDTSYDGEYSYDSGSSDSSSGGDY
jgi:tetratricopeptide (TPR) repeat protein